MHQAGHFHQAFQRAFQPVQADLRGTRAQLAEQRADDETPGLLHFQGMGQAAAHRRVALQREDLGLLLQATHGGGIDDAPAVAFQLVDDVLQIGVPGMSVGFPVVRTLAGYPLLEIHGPWHLALFSTRSAANPEPSAWRRFNQGRDNPSHYRSRSVLFPGRRQLAEYPARHQRPPPQNGGAADHACAQRNRNVQGGSA